MPRGGDRDDAHGRQRCEAVERSQPGSPVRRWREAEQALDIHQVAAEGSSALRQPDHHVARKVRIAEVEQIDAQTAERQLAARTIDDAFGMQCLRAVCAVRRCAMTCAPDWRR